MDKMHIKMLPCMCNSLMNIYRHLVEAVAIVPTNVFTHIN